LNEYPEFELVPIKELLPEELRTSVEKEGCIQFLPGVHKSDGFFIAKFRKVKHG
jgi:16S rRNA (cytosine967-C5)-methyltransferase